MHQKIQEEEAEPRPYGVGFFQEKRKHKKQYKGSERRVFALSDRKKKKGKGHTRGCMRPHSSRQKGTTPGGEKKEKGGEGGWGKKNGGGLLQLLAKKRGFSGWKGGEKKKVERFVGDLLSQGAQARRKKKKPNSSTKLRGERVGGPRLFHGGRVKEGGAHLIYAEGLLFIQGRGKGGGRGGGIGAKAPSSSLPPEKKSSLFSEARVAHHLTTCLQKKKELPVVSSHPREKKREKRRTQTTKKGGGKGGDMRRPILDSPAQGRGTTCFGL